jgi:hypothetical protein
MKKWIFKILVAAISCYGTNSFALTSPSSKINTSIIGNYSCKGYDPVYQHHYKGRLTINPNPNAPHVYLIKEGFNDLDLQKNVGIGYIYNNSFVTLFQDPSYGAGVQIYTISSDGDLTNSKFLYYNHTNKGVGTESCTKNSSTTQDKNVKW